MAKTINKEGNSYIFLYSTVLVLIVAFTLSLVSLWLQPIQYANIENEKRQDILKSVKIETTREKSKEMFEKTITRQFIVNSRGEEIPGDAFSVDLSKEVKKACEEKRLPVYVANIKGETKYILPVQGAGLWGPMWGYIALNEDKNTIFDAVFDHKGETPGLGAEIAHAIFSDQFIGKTIFEHGQLVSIHIKKGGSAHGPHEVDGISGGTITSKGVEAMISNYLKCYESFLKQRHHE